MPGPVVIEFVAISYDYNRNIFWATVSPPTSRRGFTFEGSIAFGTNILTGGDGGDHITAMAPDRSYIYGMGGNDTIIGNGAILCSYLDGGLGNDSIEGGFRADTIVGGPGDDTIDGRAGDDVIGDIGGEANIDAGTGDDRITFNGHGGSIDGGFGNDTINATNMGGSHDLLEIDPGPGNDTLFLKGYNIQVKDSIGGDVITFKQDHWNIVLKYGGAFTEADKIINFQHRHSDKVDLTDIRLNYHIPLHFDQNINDVGDVWLYSVGNQRSILNINIGHDLVLGYIFEQSTIYQGDILL